MHSIFLADFHSIDELKHRQLELGEDDDRSIAHLLIDQVEFADVILLNKSDLVSDKEMQTLYGIIRSLNRDAKIVESTRCRIPLDEIVNTHLFDFDRASQSPGWMKVMRGDEGSEIDEYVFHHSHLKISGHFILNVFTRLCTLNLMACIEQKGTFRFLRNPRLWERLQSLVLCENIIHLVYGGPVPLKKSGKRSRNTGIYSGKLGSQIWRPHATVDFYW